MIPNEANINPNIIHTTLKPNMTVLEGKVMIFPSIVVAWQFIAHKFELVWDLLHCLGSFDRKHINFRSPRNEGVRYRNYRGTDSIVLLGLTGAEYKLFFCGYWTKI